MQPRQVLNSLKFFFIYCIYVGSCGWGCEYGCGMGVHAMYMWKLEDSFKEIDSLLPRFWGELSLVISTTWLCVWYQGPVSLAKNQAMLFELLHYKYLG